MNEAAGALRRRPPAAIPVTLLTGFLGAGKTTLLNALVQAPELARSVVVINEFGDVALDHLLVEQTEGDLLTLSSGCVCCTVRGDLVALLEDLLRRRDNNRMAPFERLIVETTGLADPGPIVNAIAHHPYLVMRYRLDGVVTVVDALHGAATLVAHHEAVDQVALADAVVLSKADLAPDTSLIRARVAALNPRAPLLDAAAGGAGAGAILAAIGAAVPLHAPLAGPDTHDHGHGAAGHHHHHHGDVASLAFTAPQPVPLATVSMFLDLLLARHREGLLRAKGLFALADDPLRPLVVQVVRDTLHPPRRLASWPDGEATSRLVVIGRALDAAALQGLWAAFFGGPAVDRPDAAAFMQGREPGLF